MKKLLFVTFGLLAAIAAAVAQDVNQPMPSSAKPYQGHGGIAYGKARPLNDLELTAIARGSETVSTLSAAQAKAQQSVVAATFASPRNPAAVQTALTALADAELKLAVARSETYAKVKAELKATAPEKLEAIKKAL